MDNVIFLNKFKVVLVVYQVQIGCWCVLVNLISIEVLGLVGFDWLVLDVEYVLNDVIMFILQLMVLKGSFSVQVVCVLINEFIIIKCMLDIGFYNFLVLFVEMVEQVVQVVVLICYLLEGICGVFVFYCGNMFGIVLDYFVQFNKNIFILVQIESQIGVDNVEVIVVIEGVDGVFVGLSDLVVVLGYLGNVVYFEVQCVIQYIFVSVKKYGKLSGILVLVEVDVCCYLEWGVIFVVVGSDLGVFCFVIQKFVDVFKK